MNLKGLLLVLLTLLAVGVARPKSRIVAPAGGAPPESESQPETKIREKRKYEIPLLRELEEGGVGVKRETGAEGAEVQAEGSAVGAEAGSETETPPTGAPRVKKQSPNNIGGCGKTVCGPVVSARGPVVSDMRAMMQPGKPIISLGELHAPVMSDVTDASHKIDRFTPVQARTVDTIVAPIALGTLGYGAPASYSAQTPTVDLAHSFFKPPSVPSVSTVPALAVIAAPHQPPNPLVHLMPHLMPHLIPHLMAPLMSNLGSYFTPHSLEPSRFPETFQPAAIKQPVPTYSPPSYSIGGDNTLLCQPFRNQRLDGPYDYIYRPESAVDKSINVSDSGKKSAYEEDDKVYDHLRKVNEIKDEIRQLNRAAQRIVDQQERLTALQQKQLWGSSSQSSSSSTEHLSNPYMGTGYYSHPAMPWGYSRSNIFSYPRSQNDIDFFINLLQAGKKMGLLSDVVQPTVLSTIGDALKGVTDTGKSQKDAPDAAEVKPTKTDKKSVL